MRTNRAHQALRQHGFNRRRNEERLDAHVNQTGESARRVVRVEGAEHQVTGQRGANRNLGGLQITNFADHDDIGVLAQNVTQTDGERQANVRAHRDLIDALQFILDRFLDRDDALVHRVNGAEAGV